MWCLDLGPDLSTAQNHVLEGHDDRQGPKEQRQYTQYVVGRDGHMPADENFLECIQDAGSDIAVDDADGAKRERREGGFFT